MRIKIKCILPINLMSIVGCIPEGGGLNFNPAEDAFRVREQADAKTLVLSLLGLCKAMDWGRVAMYSPHFTRKSLQGWGVIGGWNAGLL
jgi:hypothetical protein